MISYNFVKRTIDFGISLLLIILTLPFQILIAFALLIIIKENPIFFQKRGLTLETYRFTMVKFKTMVSSQIKVKHNNQPEEIFLIPESGAYLNTFTHWLRKSGLDELPQIYNVLIGEMSFIGPRPLMIQDLEILKDKSPVYYKQRETIASKPGITGIWQIIGDRSRGAENLVSLDIFYEEKKSLVLDLIIFLSTIPMIIFARNSDEFIPLNDYIKRVFTRSLEYFDFIPSKELLTKKPE